MKKILYACVCNNGGMLRVAEWCQRYSVLDDNVVFIIFTKKPFAETDSLKYIDWEEDNNIFSKEKISFYENEIERKIDVTQFHSMIGDYLTLAYFQKFDIPFFYDVHILGKPMHEKIHQERKLFALDNEFLVTPLNSVIDIISFEFMRFENKWIRKAQGYFVNSRITKYQLEQYYRDETQGKPVVFIPLSGVNALTQSPKYSQRNFQYHCYTFSRLHPQKGYHFLFYKDWKDSPLFVRGIHPEHIKTSGQENLKRKSITLLGWTNQFDVIKNEIVGSRFILFPSIYEPFGLALQEALSYGAICICHRNNSGHEEQIKHGENGFLIDMTQENWMSHLNDIMELPMNELDLISENAIKSTRIGDMERNVKFQKVIQKEISFLSENQ